MRFRSLILIGLLAACGVDGAPTPPAAATTPGLTFSGTVSAGVATDGG